MSDFKAELLTSRFENLDFYQCRILRSFNKKLAVMLDHFKSSHTGVKSRKREICERSLATAKDAERILPVS